MSEGSEPGLRVLHESQRLRVAEPRVTVCVSLHEYELTIRECLDSVAAQSLDAVSLIVVDDGSSDGGDHAAKAWMEAHDRRFCDCRLLRHEQNEGLAAARNSAVASSSTEFVFILDADNALRPRCLASLVEALDLSSAAFAYSIIEQFGELQGLIGCDAWSAETLARGNYVDAMALLRRDTWERVGGYRRMRTPGWEDFDFWCRCAEAGLDGVLVPEILCRYRVHARSMLRRSTDTLRNHLRVCEELRAAHPWVEL